MSEITHDFTPAAADHDDNDTGLAGLALPGAAGPHRTHEHGWVTESRHHTSEGLVRYVRCLACGTRRVDLQQRAELPATALSAEIA